MKFSFNKIDSTASPVSSPADDRARMSAKKAATEFEALLLTQLTASLNPKDDGDEESIFGGGGGMSLSRQMFSEQLAKTMSESGGIGLADMVLLVGPRGQCARPRLSVKTTPLRRSARVRTASIAKGIASRSVP